VASADAQHRAHGRWDDHAFRALSATLYEPKWRIGFLVCGPDSASRAQLMSEFVQKIKSEVHSRPNDKGFSVLRASHDVSFLCVIKAINRIISRHAR
jgi:hypothetical protein